MLKILYLHTNKLNLLPANIFNNFVGLRGIYIASQINQDAWAKLHSGSPSKGSSGKSVEPKDLVSLITFNGGGLWSPIRGPVQDEEGRNVSDCAELPDGGCSLHLAQQLSKKVFFL